MPYYATTEDLYSNLKLLFSCIDQRNTNAVRSVSASKLVIRLRFTAPEAEITINGKVSPARLSYGPSSLRPDLDVMLPADALHQILMGQLSLKKAVGSGEMKVKGPVWKSFTLEEIFRQGQVIYPAIINGEGCLPQ